MEKKNFKKKEQSTIDVHNQDLMIQLGLHPRHKESRDPNVWTKSKHEKEIIKEARRRFGRGI